MSICTDAAPGRFPKVSVAVAPNYLPSDGKQLVQDFSRLRPTLNEITRKEDLIKISGLEVLEDSVQRDQIAMGIRDDPDAHSQTSSVPA